MSRASWRPWAASDVLSSRTPTLCPSSKANLMSFSIRSIMNPGAKSRSSIDGPCPKRVRLDPELFATTSYRMEGSTPALAPKTNPSYTPWALIATIRLFASLTTAPAPRGPQW